MNHEQEAARLRRQIDAAQAQIDRLNRPRTGEEMNQLSAAYARADAVAGQFGEQAMQALPGESTLSYRKRLAARYQKHSPQFRAADLHLMSEQTFAPIEEVIYADAVKAANDPASYPPGTLKPIKERDESGRTITRWVGDPMAWMQFFCTPSRVGHFNQAMVDQARYRK